MEPRICTVQTHGPHAHKHTGSFRWFYKPAPERPFALNFLAECGPAMGMPGVTRG